MAGEVGTAMIGTPLPGDTVCKIRRQDHFVIALAHDEGHAAVMVCFVRKSSSAYKQISALYFILNFIFFNQRHFGIRHLLFFEKGVTIGIWRTETPMRLLVSSRRPWTRNGSLTSQIKLDTSIQRVRRTGPSDTDSKLKMSCLRRV